MIGIGKIIITIRRKITTIKKYPPIIIMATKPRTEVHAHGFAWEQDLLRNVYGATTDELKTIKYTSKMDLPAELNRLDACDLSVKTTGNPNAICMGDCLRVFDAMYLSASAPTHLVVIHYQQDDATRTKKISTITELDLTAAGPLLFGDLTRPQLEELDKAVKAVPQKRKPTTEEYAHMYALRDKLQAQSNGALHLDIKCNSTQSRLQCSFNHFQAFLEKNMGRVIARSTTNEFRGGKIAMEVSSPRRTFKKTVTL